MKKFWNKRIGVIAALVLVAVSPLMLQRPEAVSRSEADEVLVVITPHNETPRVAHLKFVWCSIANLPMPKVVEWG